ncbi:orotidine-5'-phosphate decarboxylase [Lactovum odontotermitis]
MYEEKPIIALDFPTAAEAFQFLGKFPSDERLYVKIGMELFYSGSALIETIKLQGHSIFLDLKLHDIPNTVQSAMKVLGHLGVDMVNVHAAGGFEMMQAAREGLLAAGSDAKLIAVTQLTSTSEAQMQHDQGIMTSLEESVLHYAKLTADAGLDGVVCSAFEAQKIKSVTNPDFICLTPGIRPQGSAAGDQKRVMTPGQARQNGADYIVVGRPITQATDPVSAYKQIFDEWNEK